MQTIHRLFYTNAKHLPGVDSESVDLVVTSPQYPMIEMWDELFIKEDSDIGFFLNEKGMEKQAFARMHTILDAVWFEMDRVLKPGGIICINIGDSTRNMHGMFSLYPSHSFITNFFYDRGYYSLPEIIWRKQTNGPNKYMGSGMLPVGAYVTLEHEYILIFRKGVERRKFNSPDEKLNRRESAFFWEERNEWFSDIWDIKGVAQKLREEGVRERSAAFPLEIAYRLINMFSVKGDTVIDPFIGTGTTSAAAVIAGRNSIGVEIDEAFSSLIEKRVIGSVNTANLVIPRRLQKHIEFVIKREVSGKEFKYENKRYGFPVVSRMEEDIYFNLPKGIDKKENCIIINYQ